MKGIIQRLSTSNSRNSLRFNWLVGIINESNSILLKLVYSYDQYHWCPIDLIVKLILFISSVKYNNLIDGIAIKIKIIMGITVQINSIVWPSNKYRLVIFRKSIDIIMYIIIKVIKIIIIIVKSWKKIIIS